MKPPIYPTATASIPTTRKESPVSLVNTRDPLFRYNTPTRTKVIPKRIMAPLQKKIDRAAPERFSEKNNHSKPAIIENKPPTNTKYPSYVFFLKRWTDSTKKHAGVTAWNTNLGHPIPVVHQRKAAWTYHPSLSTVRT